jgi:hypothetical protein
MKKVFFENDYTPFVKPEDEDFFLELLTIFYDYNKNELEEDDLSVVENVLKELESIREIPKYLAEEEESIENMSSEDLYNRVEALVRNAIQDMVESGSGEKEALLSGLSARVALGLGLRYEDEEKEEEKLIEVSYDEKKEEWLFENFELSEEESGE